MIINTAPQNEAILSNVGEIGEFRIRNSAKAFNILSSGLYANKIRAIIRELSCNAVDSHTAAGKQDTPFDVHLPNQLEPWFAIRDYGTGLNHEQVTNIYTTYFESTKTNSNDFIGALGLGSKSPFSYTDNFTVTAIKDGVKGIYSAFINDAGVPSIAKMGEEQTAEPAGVEIKFSVSDRYDFSKFQDEARSVYTYFKLRPVVSGVSDFRFRDVEYDAKDIIPGVHSYTDGHRRAVAIMGNIAYPIDVPNTEQAMGELRLLLNCGLEMHFAIGELDFQASREGLSYIPQTVDAIKRKLEAVNNQLAIHIAKEADAIPNLWDRAMFLYKKSNTGLWSSAVKKYVADTKLETYDDSRYGGTKTFKLTIEDLAKKYNITIRGFNYAKHTKAYPNRKSDIEYVKKADGSHDHISYWGITVEERIAFVINDTNVGALERAKFHYRTTKPDNSATVFVLDKIDKIKPMNTKAFFKAICNPPAERISQASALEKKERADSGLGKNVTILCLQERGSGGYYRQREMVWRDAGKADSFDDAQTYYYLPLSGFEVQSKHGMADVKQFYNDLKDCGLTGLKTTIYGVRKGDIEFIKTQKNWINIEDHIVSVLSKPIDNKLVMSLVLQAVDNFNLLSYTSNIVNAVTNPNSPYVKLVSQFEGFEKIKYSDLSLKRLCNRYAPGVTFSPEAQVQKFTDECATISKRYPLLAYLRSAPNTEVAEYVNLIDTQKGV
jgi:hypothetical protein